MEWLLGFLAGIFINWIAVGVLILAGVVLADNDHDIVATIIFAVLAAVVVKLMGITLTPVHLVIYTVGYIIVGFLWSFWRYRRYVAKKVDEIKESSNISDETKMSRLGQLKPNKMVDEIVLWVMTWPFSFISNLVSDITDAIKTLVKTALNRVYEWIYKQTLKQFEIEVPK